MTYTDAVRLNRPAEFFTDISTKLNLVTVKIKSQKKKALNVIVFNIPESESPNSPIEISKGDLKTIQEILGQKKIMKSEFNSFYRIVKVIRDKCRPVILKLNDLNAKQRLIKLRNLKGITKGKRTQYI